MASFLYLLLSLFVLPLLLLLTSKFTSSQNKYRLPPGPWTLPILGSIHHLAGRDIPHRALQRLSRQYGHLMSLKLGELRVLIVSSKEGAREIMKTHDQIFCTRPLNPIIELLTYGGKDIGFAPYGEYWREMRKICALELFSSKRVQSFRSIREEKVKSLVQEIRLMSSSRQALNLSDKLSILTNDVASRATMGRTTKDQELYLRVIQDIINLVIDFGIANLFPSSPLLRMLTGAARKAAATQIKLDQILQNILREQRENEANEDAEENLLRVLLRLHDEDYENSVVTIDSIKGVIHDIIAGGTETSAATLEWAMAELMKNPRVMEKVQSELRQQLRGCDTVTESDLGELHYLHLIIKETLRLHPPGPLLVPRECQESCKILGYDILKGTIVLVNAWALGRDPNYWEDAEEFKPERFAEVSSNLQFNGGDFEFIPFGSGRRICPGISYALVLIELVLANLLFHFDWELPDGITPDELDMSEKYSLAARKKHPLCLLAHTHKC